MNWQLGKTLRVDEFQLRISSLVEFVIANTQYAGQLAFGLRLQGMIFDLPDGIQGTPRVTSLAQGVPATDRIGDLAQLKKLQADWQAQEWNRGTVGIGGVGTLLTITKLTPTHVAGPGCWSDPTFQSFTIVLFEAAKNDEERQGVLVLVGKPPFVSTAWDVTIYPQATPIVVQ